MLDFVAKNPDLNLKTKLEVIRHQIAKELFTISKVVKDEHFHTLLEKDQEVILNLATKEIPICCKINLDGFSPPLNIRVNHIDET